VFATGLTMAHTNAIVDINAPQHGTHFRDVVF